MNNRISLYNETGLFQDVTQFCISNLYGMIWIQVLGTGDRKMLTLSHKAQLRRFTSDLTKILKTQPGKQLTVSAIPEAFGECSSHQYQLCNTLYPDMLCFIKMVWDSSKYLWR